MPDTENILGKVVDLAKRRGFFVQSAEAYGGISGFYSYGPQGAPLKSNVEDAWRKRFKIQEGHQEIDAPTVMPEPVFEASGHLETFNDMLIDCPECTESHRADHLIEEETDIEDAEALPLDSVEDLLVDNDISCPNCGHTLSDVSVEDFNLMFKTNIGPGSSSPGYLRPETVQGIFVEFPRLKEYARGQLPFGVTQIGRAYRNEISPRRSIIRTREFTQAELDLFIDPEEHAPSLEEVADIPLTLYSAPAQQDNEGKVVEMTVEEAATDGPIDSEWIAYYLGVSRQWYECIGIDMNRFRFRQHLPGERSHYASDCWDAEARIDGNWVELSGFSYRSDYDLRKHGEHSNEDFTIFKEYDREKTVERPTLNIDMSELGPRFGETSKRISERLETLVETDPDVFDGDTVEIIIDEEVYEIPTELTGFEIQERTVNGEHIVPHVVEPSFGVDRIVYTILHHNYREDQVDGENRAYLELDTEVAPTTVAVFPLMSQDGMADRARQIESRLRREGISTTYDDSGAIGRRYRRQDEIGTPFCVTVDHQTLDDDTVTLRERDSTDQRRIPLEEIIEVLQSLRQDKMSFDDLSEYQYV